MAFELDQLPEHSAPQHAANDGRTYNPGPDAKKAIKLAEKCLKEAKQEKEKYAKDWLKYYKMFRGKQWFQQRPSYRHSEVINLIFQAIQSQVPLLTDSRPRIAVMAQEPSDLEFADLMNEVLEADWEKNNWLYTFIEMLYFAKFNGTAISETGYDADAHKTYGCATYEAIDPFFFFPDPDAKDINHPSCNYVLKVEFKALEKVKREAPEDVKEFIKADVVDFYGYDKTNLKEEKFRSPADQMIHFEEKSSEGTGDRDMVMLVTLYIRDQEIIEEACKDEETGEEKYVQKLKYPNGRRIKVANKVLLEDIENPFEDGEFPFERLINYVDPGAFWGISEIEQLQSPQQAFNKILSFSLDVLTLMGNPIWIVDDDSDVDENTIENRPGGVIVKTKGSEVRREEGVQLQPFVMQLLDRYKGWFEEASGSTDVTRGVTDQVTAASAIESLQEAAKTRVRQQAKLADIYLEKVGQHLGSRVMQFYSAPQVFRITNKDGANKYFKFHIEENFDEAGNPIGSGKKAVMVGYAKDEAGKTFEDSANRKEIPITGSLDFKVAMGTSLPFNKEQKKKELFDLFDREIIDDVEVLKGIEYPNAEAVIERMEQKRQAAAQAEAQAKGSVA